jgi:protein arginine kinase
MTFSGPATRPVEAGPHPEYDVVVRSFASVDRNLAGWRFPHALPTAESTELASLLCSAARRCRFELARIGELDAWSRSNLTERELYSRPYLLNDDNHAALSSDACMWLAINDTNHLSVRASRPGLDISRVWETVSATDDVLSEALGAEVWAFDATFGYLMSDAGFCGSGLSGHVVIHTPALVMSGLAEIAFKRALEAGFVVSGAYSGIGPSGGSLFDLALPPAYRDPERIALGRLEAATKALSDYERRARSQLLERSPWEILDVIGRAAGRAREARLVSRDEAADIVSGLRLGLACGVLEGLSLEAVTDLWSSLRVKFSEGSRAGTATMEETVSSQQLETTTDQPEAASRARVLRQASSGIRFSQRYNDV